MIVSKRSISHPPIEIVAQSMIIDIETTGFSAKYANIYLIGFVYLDGDQYISEQWLAEKDSDEYEILFKFNQRLEAHPTLYHYNGDQFDMPFIKKRMALYNITCNSYDSIDLLKIFRPYKKVFGLENIKLKTIEAYFGYEREDQFTGGDLIPVYKNYLDTHSQDLQKDLLGHNYEDLVGLMDVLNHLPLIDRLKAYKNRSIPIDLTYSTIENDFYKGKFSTDLTASYHLTHPLYELEVVNQEITIQIPITVTSLHYYFPNPKDYYYLVNEDYAIHKSVGQFVSKDHRVQATSKNAYIKKEGFFLPALKKYDLPYPIYHNKDLQNTAYVSVDDLVETQGFNTYIEVLLSQL